MLPLRSENKFCYADAQKIDERNGNQNPLKKRASPKSKSLEKETQKRGGDPNIGPLHQLGNPHDMTSLVVPD